MITKTPGRVSAFHGACRIKYLFLCGLSLALLSSTACDAVSSTSPFSSKNSSETNQQITPKPLVIPEDQGLLMPPTSSSDGLRTTDMAGPLGLNTQRLFAEPIKDDDRRFDRLETSVQSLRDEFDNVSPSVHRLMDIEKDIQDLVEQLEVLLAEEASAPPVAKNLPPRPTPPKAATPAKPQAAAATSMPTPIKASGANLSTIRMADHSGNTRIVLEAGEKLNYTAELDNSENLLMLTFSSGSLGLDPSSVRKTSKMVKSVSGTPQSEGFILAFSLGSSSSILKQGYLPPNKDNPNHRIFIDIAN